MNIFDQGVEAAGEQHEGLEPGIGEQLAEMGGQALENAGAGARSFLSGQEPVSAAEQEPSGGQNPEIDGKQHKPVIEAMQDIQKNGLDGVMYKGFEERCTDIAREQYQFEKTQSMERKRGGMGRSED